MPKRCAFGCFIKPGVSYHAFPNLRRNRGGFEAWVSVLGGKLENNSDIEFYKNKVICDIHFPAHSKNRNNRLSYSAVPTLHLTGSNTIPSGNSVKTNESDTKSLPEATSDVINIDPDDAATSPNTIEKAENNPPKSQDALRDPIETRDDSKAKESTEIYEVLDSPKMVEEDPLSLDMECEESKESVKNGAEISDGKEKRISRVKLGLKLKETNAAELARIMGRINVVDISSLPRLKLVKKSKVVLKPKTLSDTTLTDETLHMGGDVPTKASQPQTKPSLPYYIINKTGNKSLATKTYRKSSATENISDSPATQHISLSPATQHISISPATQHISISPATQHISVSPATQHISNSSKIQRIGSPANQYIRVPAATQNFSDVPPNQYIRVPAATQNISVSPTTQNISDSPVRQYIRVPAATQNFSDSPANLCISVLSTTKKISDLPANHRIDVSMATKNISDLQRNQYISNSAVNQDISDSPVNQDISGSAANQDIGRCLALHFCESHETQKIPTPQKSDEPYPTEGDALAPFLILNKTNQDISDSPRKQNIDRSLRTQATKISPATHNVRRLSTTQKIHNSLRLQDIRRSLGTQDTKISPVTHTSNYFRGSTGTQKIHISANSDSDQVVDAALNVIKDLQFEVRSLKAKVRNKESHRLRVEKKNELLKKKMNEMRKKRYMFDRLVQDVTPTARAFYEMQLLEDHNRGKRRKYSVGAKVFALTIFKLSRPCYYLLSKYFKLPSPAYLKKYVSEMKRGQITVDPAHLANMANQEEIINDEESNASETSQGPTEQTDDTIINADNEPHRYQINEQTMQVRERQTTPISELQTLKIDKLQTISMSERQPAEINEQQSTQINQLQNMYTSEQVNARQIMQLIGPIRLQLSDGLLIEIHEGQTIELNDGEWLLLNDGHLIQFKNGELVEVDAWQLTQTDDDDWRQTMALPETDTVQLDEEQVIQRDTVIKNAPKHTEVPQEAEEPIITAQKPLDSYDMYEPFEDYEYPSTKRAKYSDSHSNDSFYNESLFNDSRFEARTPDADVYPLDLR